MSGNLIECVSLSKLYIRNKQIINAVDDVNLRIRQNEFIILEGRSGAGKSTLLNLMCGLIKPTTGRVMIYNTSISELPNYALSEMLLNRIGIIFQSFNLLPTYTVYENIEIALIPKGLDKSKVKENIMSLLDQFSLKQYFQSLPSELSVGQQQRVAIIRTLIKEPSIIFADEPTGSVDEETEAEILEHLIYFKKKKKLTLVIATHGNISEKFADKVYTIERGRIKN